MSSAGLFSRRFKSLHVLPVAAAVPRTHTMISTRSRASASAYTHARTHTWTHAHAYCEHSHLALASIWAMCCQRLSAKNGSWDLKIEITVSCYAGSQKSVTPASTHGPTHARRCTHAAHAHSTRTCAAQRSAAHARTHARTHIACAFVRANSAH